MDFGLTLWAAASGGIGHFATLAGRFLLVLFGINALIVVHEFGHFIVARLCGVRCEKFYIWFDAFGFRLFRFRWGNTEYGLGWLPLGGYVKMLGQEDNPGAIREELERAKQQTGEPAGEGGTTDSVSSDETARIAALEENLYSPDSYQAKSVPQRMAIISAGVVMNLLFAVLCAAGAAWIGFPEVTSRIGGVVPGSPAWTVGLRAGDVVTGLNGRPISFFTQIPASLLNGETVPFEIERPGYDQPLFFDITPRREKNGLIPTIGILTGSSQRLAPFDPPYFIGIDESQNRLFGEAFRGLGPNDELVALDGVEVTSSNDYYRAIHTEPDKTLVAQFTPFAPANGASRITVEIPPIPAAESGVRLTFGEITAVQQGSVAEGAGLVPRRRGENGEILVHGDVMVSVNNEPLTDPLNFAYRIFQLASSSGDHPATLVLTVRRGRELVDLPITLTSPPELTDRFADRGTLACDMLGVTFEVLPVLAGIDPAAVVATGENPIGGMVRSLRVKLPKPSDDADPKILEHWKSLRAWGRPTEEGFTLEIAGGGTFGNGSSGEGSTDGAKLLNFLAMRINELPDGTELTWEILPVGQNSNRAPVMMTSTVRRTGDVFLAERGLIFNRDLQPMKIDTFSGGILFGWNKTTEACGLIFRFLKNIGRTVSAKALGGPVAIAQQAWQATAIGDGYFLLFLCLIGANLAVVNILPIPVLDGGHLVFLAYEAITGKPANETIQIILSWIGLFMLLSLMVWVLGLDLFRLLGLM